MMMREINRGVKWEHSVCMPGTVILGLLSNRGLNYDVNLTGHCVKHR